MEHKWSELRLWNGGECPVGLDEMVWVLYGDMDNNISSAGDYYWSHNGESGDIIAYRVEVKPAPLIERWVNVFTDACGKERVASLLWDTEIAARIVAGPDARQILLREVRE
jgi:hypothetical protein